MQIFVVINSVLYRADEIGGNPSKVRIGSVEAFQGAEADIVLLSTVRTKDIGFMNSPNRMCVATTRARILQVIIMIIIVIIIIIIMIFQIFYGNVKALSCNSTWHHLLDYLNKHNAIFNGNIGSGMTPYSDTLSTPIDSLSKESFLVKKMRKENEAVKRKEHIESSLENNE